MPQLERSCRWAVPRLCELAAEDARDHVVVPCTVDVGGFPFASLLGEAASKVATCATPEADCAIPFQVLWTDGFAASTITAEADPSPVEAV